MAHVKRCHGALLTLIVWYLMMLPLRAYLNNPESFRGWVTKGSHDSVKESEGAAAQWQQQTRELRGCDKSTNAQTSDCTLFELWLQA